MTVLRRSNWMAAVEESMFGVAAGVAGIKQVLWRNGFILAAFRCLRLDGFRRNSVESVSKCIGVNTSMSGCTAC